MTSEKPVRLHWHDGTEEVFPVQVRLDGDYPSAVRVQRYHSRFDPKVKFVNNGPPPAAVETAWFERRENAPDGTPRYYQVESDLAEALFDGLV